MDPNQRDVVESTLFTPNFTNNSLVHQNNALTCKHITSYQGVENMCKKNHEGELNWCINPDKSSLHCTQKVRGLEWGNYQRRQIFSPSKIKSHVFFFGTSQIKSFFPFGDIVKGPNLVKIHSLPMVEEAMDVRRPSTQENGRDRAIAPVPIFPTCKTNKNQLWRNYLFVNIVKLNLKSFLTRSCSRKQK